MTALSLLFSAFLAFSTAQAGSSGSGFYVLAYHTFMGDKNMFSFSLQELDQHCDYLHKNGFTFVSYNDLAQGKIKGNKNILVTIDDGHRTVLDAYYKVLKKYNIKPLLGIYPNIISKKDYALTWEQLRQLAGDGCSIAAHGYFHSFVNEKLYRKNKKAFMDEIYKSKKILEEKLGSKVTAFIYPFGVRSPVTIRTLREAGYSYAFTINNGFVPVPLRSDNASLEVHRYMLTRTVNQSVLALILRKSRKNILVEKEPVPARKKHLTRKETFKETFHAYTGEQVQTLEPVRAALVDVKSLDNPVRNSGHDASHLISPEIKKQILEHVPGEKMIKNFWDGSDGDKTAGKVSFAEGIKRFYASLYLRMYQYYSSYVALINSNLAGLEKKVLKIFRDFKSRENKTTMFQYCFNDRSC